MSTAQRPPKPEPPRAIDPKTPQGVSIIPYRDGLFAVSRRHALEAYPFYWQFPGGRVEQGETAWEAAIREFAEETGIEITKQQLVHLGSDHPLTGYKGETYVGHRFGVVIGEHVELECTEPEKHSPWYWVTLSELSGVQMLQGVREYAAKFEQLVTLNVRVQMAVASGQVSYRR